MPNSSAIQSLMRAHFIDASKFRDLIISSRLRGTLARYGVAACAVAGVSLLRLPLHLINSPETPYLLFAVAVLVAAGFGGFGPGLLALGLSVVAGNFFFAVPYFTLNLQDPTQAG